MAFDVPDLTSLLENDPYVLSVLSTVQAFGPKGAYVAAGFVRNRVWDSYYGQNQEFTDADIDVIYFDDQAVDPEIDYMFERQLTEQLRANWQVRNQARMHYFGGYEPFISLDEALKHWAETATSVGVRLIGEEELDYIAPFGFDDLFNHILRITPAMYVHNPDGFHERLIKKAWRERWPRLRVIDEP